MAGPDREKALEMALAQIDKSFGKGSVMRLGDEVRVPIGVIPTGSIALDVALGIVDVAHEIGDAVTILLGLARHVEARDLGRAIFLK